MRFREHMSGIEQLRDLLRTTRRDRGLTLEQLADQASDRAPEPISAQQIHDLEHRYQRMPPPSVLRPVAESLGLEWVDVLRAAGYW